MHKRWKPPIAASYMKCLVKDVNDNAPIFTDPQPVRLHVEINDVRSLAPNMYVGQVNVEDPDDGDNGRVTLKIAAPMDKYIFRQQYLRAAAFLYFVVNSF